MKNIGEPNWGKHIERTLSWVVLIIVIFSLVSLTLYPFIFKINQNAYQSSGENSAQDSLVISKTSETDVYYKTRTSFKEPLIQTRGRNSTYNKFDVGKVHGGSLAGALRFGNFDEDKYQELVAVGGTSEGRTILFDYNNENDSFDSKILWWDPNGGLIALSVGELDTSHSGPEILVGGYSGNLTLLSYSTSSGTKNVTIWNTSRQNENTTRLNHIFGISIGNLDEKFSGNEIAVVDAATYKLYILYHDAGIWRETSVAVDDLPRNVVIGEFDHSHPGLEIIVLCVNGTVYEVSLDTNNDLWSVVEIFKDTNTPFNAVFEDFITTHTGNEIIITGLSWNTTLIWGSGNNWQNKTIYNAPGATEGIAYGDFDHLHDGKELCITGYLNTAVLLYETGTGWKDELIFTDPDPLQTELNGAIVTDFYTPNPGNELIIIGFTGQIRMLTFEPPDFELVSPSVEKTISAGEFATFQINLITTSGYSSKVKLILVDNPPGSTFNFSRKTLEPSASPGDGLGSSVLTIDTTQKIQAGTFNLSVIGTGIEDDREKTLYLTLKIKSKPYFQLKLNPTSTTLNVSRGEFFIEFQVTIESFNQFEGVVNIYLDEQFLNSPEVKNILSHSITPQSIGPGETAIINISISKDYTKSYEFDIPIYGRNQELELEDTQEINLNVIYFEKPGPDDSTNDEEKIPMNQLVSVLLLLFVIIIILIFMFKRMRDITRLEHARRERRQMYGPSYARGQKPHPGHPLEPTRHRYPEKDRPGSTRRRGGKY